jgi:nicotinate phosphoribosyltransferase
MLTYSITGNYTDLYEITMGEVYFKERRQDLPATFDYFFRKLPFGGGYVLFAGLHELLGVLADLHFTPEDIAFLRDRGFDAGYLGFLERFRFKSDVYSVPEGEVIFPGCPVLRVEGTLFETQLVETVLLNLLNFQSLIATKASRVRQVAGDRVLSDFGLRRAQGAGAMAASRAAIIGGFNSTSNVAAANRYGIPASGTMAHSFIESYGSELEAFRAYARSQPSNCIFLVDTYDTLGSGLPNAIKVAKEMEAQGLKASGVRLDSGDLAWLSGRVRGMMDEAGLGYMKIVVSNQLDEWLVRSLLDQDAPIDVFGVGTRLVTGHPDAALDGVYKLSQIDGEPRIKLSDTLQKTTLPGIKQVFRVLDGDGRFLGFDGVRLDSEAVPSMIYHPFDPHKSTAIDRWKKQPLVQKVMEGGRRLQPEPSLSEIAAYGRERLGLLPAEYRRFENPHTYKVGVSSTLLQLRDELREKWK